MVSAAPVSPLSFLSWWMALAPGEMRLCEPCGTEGRQEKGNSWGNKDRSGTRKSCLNGGLHSLVCSALAQLSLF